MTSKQLNSILKSIPSTSVNSEKTNKYTTPHESTTSKTIEETDRIVAVIPKILKDEIKEYLKSNKKETERVVILRALKAIGFNIREECLIDKRSIR
jgi:hypothetical protein